MPIKKMVVSIIFLCSFACASAQSSRALLIAIDKYPASNGWNEIHATNDLKLIQPFLLQQGFRSENIVKLSNHEATKVAIVEALQQLAIKSRIGDYIYIHFSCHGQQMVDNNGDEADGLDEALIPYDAQRRYSRGVYEGENHLRDDELQILLNKIRSKVGSKGSVVLILDACHSGTADRNYEEDIYVRGTSYVFAPDDFVRSNIYTNDFIDQISAHPKMANITVIAACQADELNYEYKCQISGLYYGSLTYSLCRIWQSDKPDSLDALRTALIKQITKIKPRRGKIQTPLLQTSDEKKAFKIGL